MAENDEVVDQGPLSGSHHMGILLAVARPQHGALMRRLVEPTAAELGVPFDHQIMFGFGELDEIPDPRPEGIAIGLLWCGAQLLSSRTYADEFPADGRLARRGAKTLLRSFGSGETIDGSVMLAHAQALLAAERQACAGNDEDAQAHEAVVGLIQTQLPIPQELVIQVVADRERSFAHARSLRGEALPPTAAPESVAAHTFLQWVMFHALTLVLGDEFMGRDGIHLPGVGYQSMITGVSDLSTVPMSEEFRMRFVEAAFQGGYLSHDAGDP